MTLPVQIVASTGDPTEAIVEPRLTLADFLREECGLTGTHLGCEHGVCGACTVLLDGAAVRSCLIFAVQADGRRCRRSRASRPTTASCSPVQAALRECHGLNAGSAHRASSCRSRRCCRTTPTPPMTRSAKALSGNLCRCTGYQGIVNAVRRAAELTG